MKSYKILFLIITYLLLLSCSEQSRDEGWELKEKQELSKKKLITELNKLFELALINAEEAEFKLGELNTKLTSSTPIMENDKELLNARKNVVKSIETGRLITRLKNNFKNINYSRIELSAKLIRDEQKGSPNDIGSLLQYIKHFNTLKKEVEKYSIDKETIKRYQEYINNFIKEIEEELKSYPELYGKENELINSTWKGIKYSFNQSTFSFDEEGIQKETNITFKENGKIECSSVMIPYIINGIDDDPSKTFKDNPEITEIALRGEDPMRVTYTAEKQIKKEGEYYLGTKFLSLVFHFQDDYEMILSINYDNEIFNTSDKTKIIPLRDPKKYSYYPPPGESRVYIAIINNKKHCGVARPFDSYLYQNFLYGKQNIMPFSLIKSNK